MTTTPENDRPGAQYDPSAQVSAGEGAAPQHTDQAGAERSAPHPAPMSHTAPTTQLPENVAEHQQTAAWPQGAPVGSSAPGAPAGPAGPSVSAGPSTPAGTATAAAHPKSRSGALLAGLAIGALLGGVVGGGVAAIVASNAAPQTVAQSGNSGTLTLNNADNATQISGVAAVATPSVVTLEVAGEGASGSGSGVIYREDGYIITNAHVVTLDGATFDPQVRVKLSDGRILDGEVVGTAPYADLAVVKVDADNLPAIKTADSSQLNVGDLAVAIGAPLNLANTVTSGVVSAVNRGISVGSALVPQDPTPQQDEGGSGSAPWDFRFGLPGEDQQQEQQQSNSGTVTLPVIQTDASINPGNSGGALLNGNGELIGINVAIASPTSSQGVAGSDGLGFAIPVNLATRVADEIIDGEKPSHGLLGASVADSSQDTDEDANHAGGLLVDVPRGGAAAKAGLRAGDVITAVDGVPAVDGTSVSALVRMHEGGSKVSIEYTRGGQPHETEATLGTLEW
ncbi:S1C family serine protease [Leucobacter tenebrionis]|uniref:S1C family serine protease n=1 Tax=Leucobacter tenebrionis TaxID=2873270 RepID=UPI001CA78074|nr:trypsin-like peptidase domain-containing protein [Leucobacter tenebrionis]QZY52464.1 trypsin-like peptidase domain-containing protein [Leucobacter tenebrionis]